MVQISATADQKADAIIISIMKHPILFILSDVGFDARVYTCLIPNAMKTIQNISIAVVDIAPDSESQ
jgi:hypothetical protein